jgi:hypothetical protein
MRHLTSILILGLAAAACDKDEPKSADSGAAASATATASAAPTASATASAAPTASALPDRTDCPKGSSGPGTFDKPCIGKGATRMMEVVSTGKADDKGNPQFKVTNKSPAVVLYGKIAVYYYDKAGKQLNVKGSDGKEKSFLTCGGNIFGGVMKVNEKATVSFSCVTKDSTPDGTATMEGEIEQVGFSSDEKKSDFYWRNPDLVPDQRKKGGVK